MSSRNQLILKLAQESFNKQTEASYYITECTTDKTCHAEASDTGTIEERAYPNNKQIGTDKKTLATKNLITIVAASGIESSAFPINEQKCKSNEDIEDPFNADSEDDPNYSPSEGEESGAENDYDIVENIVQQDTHIKRKRKSKCIEKVGRKRVKNEKEWIDVIKNFLK